MVYFFIFLWAFTSVCAEYNLSLFDLEKNYDNGKKYYTINELIKTALEYSTETREEIEVLYQAYKTVKVKIGQVAPSLNIQSLIGFVIDRAVSRDTVMPFVSFLFPSRWFDWKSSKFLYLAERESLATIFANKVQIVLNLYYNIQMQVWSIRILEYYDNEIEKLIKYLQDKNQNGINKATKEDIAILENIKSQFKYERAFIDGLSSLLPRLASAIGLAPDFDWFHLKIKPYKFKSLHNKKDRNYFEFWPRALESSSEIRNIDYLIMSANQDKKSIYFDFIDPGSGNDLGYGYGQRIKIARSKIAVLKIQKERSRMQLSNAIQDALNNYNDSVDSFLAIDLSLDYLEDIRRGVDKHINDNKVPLDITRVIRYFDIAKGQAMRLIFSYFTFRVAQADLNRYTWNGKYYDIARYYINKKVPQFLEKVKENHLDCCCK